jgi:hypothetical protein
MPSYDVTRCRSSHNSYSGGARGSLLDQLNANVRCLEFDFHDNDYDTLKDYRIGHLKPGAEVDRTPPNPPDDLLGSWLNVISAWSTANPLHAPITIILDAKDDLTDNPVADLEVLNRQLESVFGSRLFTREEFERQGSWPDVTDMRGKIVCVLSGNGGSRAAYRWSMGTTPALGGNTKGDVLVAYRSSSAEINLWAGRVKDGEDVVEWVRKSRLAVSDIDLAEPAIQINDDGWAIAVYRFGPRPAPQPHGLMLASKVGKVHDGQIKWGKVQVLSDGMTPSLRVDGDDVELIFANASGGGRQLMTGVIDRSKKEIKWTKAKATQRQLFPRGETKAASRTVRAEPDALGAIHCSVDGGEPAPVRFRQVLFVERQKGEDPKIFRDAPFFGAGAANRADIAAARAEGLVARAWGFAELDRPDANAAHRENFPATDTPLMPWYHTYIE